MVNDTITLFSDSLEVGRGGHNLLKENNIHLTGHAHAGLQRVEVIITTLALKFFDKVMHFILDHRAVVQQPFVYDPNV